jgi:hypothetical protein
MRLTPLIVLLAACAAPAPEPFDAVEVQGPLHVSMVPGERFEVRPGGATWAIADGVLRLTGAAPFDVELSVARAVNVAASGGAQVALADLVASRLELSATRGARIAGAVDADTLVVRAEDDAQVSLTGTARVVDARGRGDGCAIDLASVTARVARVEVDCQVEVQAREVVRGSASAGAHVVVTGPARVELVAPAGVVRRVEVEPSGAAAKPGALGSQGRRRGEAH